MKSFSKIAKVLVAVLIVIAIGVVVMAIWGDAAATFLNYIFEELGMTPPEKLLELIGDVKK